IAENSETEFTIGASDSRRVTASVDLAARKVSFVGSYSSYSDSIFDTITRIADHVKGQVFVEGEPWQPKEDHLKNMRSAPWWVWLILLPFILVVFVVALPFLLIYWCYQLWSVFRRKT